MANKGIGLTSPIDSTGTVAHYLDTENALGSSGELLALRNNGTDKLTVGSSGEVAGSLLELTGNATGAGDGAAHIWLQDDGDAREASIYNLSGDLFVVIHGTDDVEDAGIRITASNVDLRLAGSTKVRATSAGAAVTGTLSVTGNITNTGATEDLVLIDAGSAAATQQDWVEVTVGGNTGYIHIFAAK